MVSLLLLVVHLNDELKLDEVSRKMCTRVDGALHYIMVDILLAFLLYDIRRVGSTPIHVTNILRIRY